MALDVAAIELLEVVNGQIAMVAGRLRADLITAGLSTQAAEDAALLWLDYFWAGPNTD